MKFHLSARYSRREEIVEVQARLVVLGHAVTSRWVDATEEEVRALAGRSEAQPARERWLAETLEDIGAADCVVCFTEPPNDEKRAGRGARHVEMGYALAREKHLVVIGQRENIFHSHPDVEHYENTDEFIKSLPKVEEAVV